MRFSKSAIVAGAFALVTMGAYRETAQADTIANVEAQAPGTAGLTIDQNPTVSAILSAPGSVNGLNYTNWSVLANDGTGSLSIFGHMPTGNPYTPAVGDIVNATGTYSPFHQIPELASLSSISLVSSGNPVPAVQASTIAAPQCRDAAAHERRVHVGTR